MANTAGVTQLRVSTEKSARSRKKEARRRRLTSIIARLKKGREKAAARSVPRPAPDEKGQLQTASSKRGKKLELPKGENQHLLVPNE